VGGVKAAAFPLAAFETREERDLAMAGWLEQHGASLIACAGYMQLLTPAFLARFPNRVVNIHPSLLPAFPGLDTHARALAAGVRFTGCTVHFVRTKVDEGPIVVQAVVPVLPRDDEEALAARVLSADGLFALVEPWLTPFLTFVHTVIEIPVVRRLSSKSCAVQLMSASPIWIDNISSSVMLINPTVKSGGLHRSVWWPRSMDTLPRRR
jgi:phosphoribosylglycinamide formyltransferase-1